MTVSSSAVAIDDVSFGYGDTDVCHEISADAPRGQVTALLGPSGCGKSTLLRLIAGLERPRTGTIRLHGEVVSDGSTFVPPQRRGVGLVFQDGVLFDHLSVASNIGFGLPRGSRRSGSQIDDMLALTGLTELADRLPNELSGGERQRVALARALAPEPSVVLLDEPFANLDTQLRSQVRDDVIAIVRRAGVGAVLVTHDRTEALSCADHVVVMKSGRVHAAGPPVDLYNHPATRWVGEFLGDANVFLRPDPARVFLLRPEHVAIDRAPTATPRALMGLQVAATVTRVQFFGPFVAITARPTSAEPIHTGSGEPLSPPVELHALARGAAQLSTGTEVLLRFEESRLMDVACTP